MHKPDKEKSEALGDLQRNLEETIKPKDTLYYLGDLSFNEKAAYKFFEKLIDIEILLHPIAPHMTEETWEALGKNGYASLAA